MDFGVLGPGGVLRVEMGKSRGAEPPQLNPRIKAFASSTEGIPGLNKKSSGSPPGRTLGRLAKVPEKMSKRCQKVVAGGRRQL